MKTEVARKQRRTIAYLACSFGELNGPKRQPFFRVRLDSEQIEELLGHLDACVAASGRKWFALTATHEKPERLRLTEDITPGYEINAAPIYLRGEPVRISGGEGSCTITFSGSVGAMLLAERLRAGREKMRRFVEIRVRSRTWNQVEFIPDIDLEAMETLEHQKLGRTGVTLAGEIWAGDDFSDWESHHG